MQVEYHKDWSACLNQEMEYKVYGSTGKPVLVFPAQGGKFYEFEDFGMLNAVSGLIDSGSYRFYTVDSIDNQSWSNWNILPSDRAMRHEAYDRYIRQEFIPTIQNQVGSDQLFLATGCSMGGFHSANFFFRHPDLFDSVISLSGLFQLRLFVGDTIDNNIYFNTPLYYLRNLTDAWYLEKYRQSKIVICAGQGAWEEAMNDDIRELRQILEDKNIPAWIDLWGYDVNHDWPWWRKQLPYFLEKLLTQDKK
jgi:esterase/lipase superfamily enzyme